MANRNHLDTNQQMMAGGKLRLQLISVKSQGARMKWALPNQCQIFEATTDKIILRTIKRVK